MKSRVHLAVAAVAFALILTTSLKAVLAGPDIPPEAMPVLAAAPLRSAEPAQADPSHVTLAIYYEGPSPSVELTSALAGLQAAGRVSAFDADSAPGRVYVLGAEEALLALRDLPGVLSIGRVGNQRDKDSRAAAGSPSQPADTPTAFYLSLSPDLPAAERSRLIARLDDMRARGQVISFSDQGRALHVIAPPAARERLVDVHGVTFSVEVLDASKPAYYYMGTQTTSAPGTFRIGRLPAGSYKVQFADTKDSYLTEFFDDKPDFARADTLGLTAGVTATIGARLGLGGVVSGTVRAEDSGVPMSNVGGNAYNNAATGSQVRSTTTDVSGAYRLAGLAGGSYKLRFVDNGGKYLTEYYSNKTALADADPVAVTAGGVTIVDAALASGGHISGQVTDAVSEAGIAGVGISLASAVSRSEVFCLSVK